MDYGGNGTLWGSLVHVHNICRLKIYEMKISYTPSVIDRDRVYCFTFILQCKYSVCN